MSCLHLAVLLLAVSAEAQLPNDPVHHWPLDEPLGATTAADHGSSPKPLTLEGEARFIGPGSGGGAWVPNNHEGCVTNSYLAMGGADGQEAEPDVTPRRDGRRRRRGDGRRRRRGEPEATAEVRSWRLWRRKATTTGVSMTMSRRESLDDNVITTGVSRR